MTIITHTYLYDAHTYTCLNVIVILFIKVYIEILVSILNLVFCKRWWKNLDVLGTSLQIKLKI